MRITIFTPTYNRANLLYEAFNSLCNQTCKAFEWLIVDDGSTDNTKEVVQSFIGQNCINIRYYKKENGGKHTAINYGVRKAESELFWILDSDDCLPVDAVERVMGYVEQMKETGAAGICGYMAHHNGKIIGNPVVKEPCVVSSLQMRYEMNLTGDMMEVFLTSVLREFPFPEFDGERFCPEILVWYRIAQKYKLLLVPDVIYERDYLEGGLTDNIIKIRMQSPFGSMITYSELFNYKIPFLQKLKSAINYWRFSFCTTEGGVKILSWGKLLAPLGWIMYIKDKRKVKK